MSAPDKSSARTIGLKLIGSIAFSELCIMLSFRLLNVEAWMPPLLIDLADALILSIVSSILILFWVVNPMKIFEERRRAEKQIRFLAYYDGLTGLPNRNFFKELLGRSIEYARRYDRRFAVMFIDLDDFKKINDTLGPDTGDQLLKVVSSRVVSSVRKSDYVARSVGEEITDIARLGGDEFTVFLQELGSPQDTGRVARRILEDIAAPLDLGGREIFITASVGISTFPDDGDNAEDLFKNADAAMYHAKGKGKNNYQFYSKAMNVSSLELLTLENDLHNALAHEELLLYYQPKLDLKTNTISGMEALIRWKHPSSGLIPPSKFIPVAEANGLIVPIGEFVLRSACRQNKMWQDAGLRAVGVAVNLSFRQFGQKNLTEQILDIVSASGLDPKYLELEITESTIMQNPEEAIRILSELRAAGIQIAIDDFGTGYSSLSYLRKLPISAIKIDISFVRRMLTDPSDAVIVRTIIAMAQSLNLKTIAEGTETEEQIAFLKHHGCDMAQGYYLSAPVPADKFQEFLRVSITS